LVQLIHSAPISQSGLEHVDIAATVHLAPYKLQARDLTFGLPILGAAIASCMSAGGKTASAFVSKKVPAQVGQAVLQIEPIGSSGQRNRSSIQGFDEC
jgi:hypothetical protein